MFSGIVASEGVVRKLETLGEGAARLVIETRSGEGFEDAAQGESIAVNGCCLTVARRSGRILEMDVIATTLQKTNLGGLNPDDTVNLERSLRMGDRLDGHLVTGHVDGTGTIRRVRSEGETRFLEVETAPHLLQGLIPQGCIAVDGISLTVADLTDDGFTAGLIPFTWDRTNLHSRKTGDAVNLELDVVGKYVYKYTSSHTAGRSKITMDFLTEHGFVT